jgi:hypothetical protein
MILAMGISELLVSRIARAKRPPNFPIHLVLVVDPVTSVRTNNKRNRMRDKFMSQNLLGWSPDLGVCVSGVDHINTGQFPIHVARHCYSATCIVR